MILVTPTHRVAVVNSPPSAIQGPKLVRVTTPARTIYLPILGLFGVEDKNPSPEEVATIDAELTRLGKEHEFHSFENAGHGFFAVDRPMYRQEAAVQGWRLLLDFYGRHLQ